MHAGCEAVATDRNVNISVSLIYDGSDLTKGDTIWSEYIQMCVRMM